MKAIYKRELRAYFNSMTGWIFVAALTVFIGIYFTAYNLLNGYTYFSYALNATLMVFMALVPVLTMRSLAEERHSKTDQLLLTSPATLTGVVLGKYFAMLTVLAAPVLLACLCPLIIRMNGTAHFKADYATLLIYFMLAAVEIAIGMLVSALTESQVIAAVGTFCLLLVLYLWDGLVSLLPTSAIGSLAGLFVVLLLVCLLLNALAGSWKLTGGVLALGIVAILGFYIKDSSAFSNLLPNALGSFSLLGAFNSFATDHVFDIPGLLLYLSLIALLVFLTVQVLQKRRWN
ncbi:putative ABC transporter permease protein [Oscillibacter valericigenes Sjm18-20]|nr:putative ABC transporter permease protein [Oscillibacter valericigenes Sjm18-20]